MEKYKFDFTTQTLTITNEFAKKANNINSAEYKLLKKFMKDFPSLNIVKRTHKSPKKPNQNKGLTYEKMERYIMAYDNCDELLKMYNKVITLSVSQKSPYNYVKEWFLAQFPNYNKTPIFVNGQLIAIPVQPKEVA